MVKLPAAGTTLVTRAVESFVAGTAITILFAVTKLFVTTTEVPAAAIFTRPQGLLIVTAPVVPTVVIVESSFTPPDSTQKAHLFVRVAFVPATGGPEIAHVAASVTTLAPTNP